MMPFDQYGAAVTFQRLMDRILQPHNQYTTAYIDDIVIYSTCWEEHLASMLQDPRNVGLTANPAKCHLGQQEVTYHGLCSRQGKDTPLDGEDAGFAGLSNSHDKEAGAAVPQHYHHFILNFVTLAVSLMNLTRNTQLWNGVR